MKKTEFMRRVREMDDPVLRFPGSMHRLFLEKITVAVFDFDNIRKVFYADSIIEKWSERDDSANGTKNYRKRCRALRDKFKRWFQETKNA